MDEIVTNVQMIVNAVNTEDHGQLVNIVSSLPSFSSIKGCSTSNSEVCIFQALLGQLANYIQSATPTKLDGATRKTVYSQIDYKAFLTHRTLAEILRTAQSSQATLLEVANYLNQQIKCNGDQLASGIFQELEGYFTSVHAFDSAKSSYDVAYIKDTINSLSKRGSSISNTVDSNLEEILIGAVVCTTADLAYQTAKLAITAARLSNPFGWLFGSADPNDLLEAMEEVSKAIERVARAAKLLDSLSTVRAQVQKIQRGLASNSKFLASVNYLVMHIDESDDNFLQQQSTFLDLYGAYTPVISKPELTQVGGYLEALVTEACDVISETEGPPIVLDIYRSYISGSGLCWRTVIAIQTMVETYTEIYDFQFDLIEQLAAVVRAKTGLNAASKIGSSWETSVQNCDSSDTLKRYAILAGTSHVTYEIQKWQAIEEYCNYLEYDNAGIRPSVCQGIRTEIANLLAFIPSKCQGYQGFTRYYSIPAVINRVTSYRSVVTPDNYAQLNVSALLAGETVHFQVPNAEWLVENGFIQSFEKDYAIYVMQFEVFLPIESSSHTSVVVRAFATASNQLVLGGTTYTITPSNPLVTEYLEGKHIIGCRGSTKFSPYSLCASSHPPDICLAGNCLQQEFLPPSIYSQWNIIVNGYEMVDVNPATDMGVQISMTLCKKSVTRQEVMTEQVVKTEAEEDRCCSKTEYWSSESSSCTPCPSGTVSALYGYFCNGKGIFIAF